MSNIDILLIYPRLGSLDNLVRDIPLSLIYTATSSVKNGYNVKILDCRVYPDRWKEKLDEYLSGGCTLVGLSVMTGNPISSSLEVSKYIKDNYNTPVVWGGPHPTILPEITLNNEYIDYIIRDWGSEPLYQLISYLKGKLQNIDKIIGLGYKRENRIFLNQETCQFEMLDYRDIPYHLIEPDLEYYNRFQGKEIFFPVFTAVGCPYQCAYCMSPGVYRKIKGKKWVPFSIDSVLDHIGYLMQKYDFTRLQVYDDDTFVKLDRMKEFLLKYIERGYNEKLKLDFRGVRINELDRMDDEYLRIMTEANVEVMLIGVEAGSDRILKHLKKGIKVEQILRVSKKLNEYPSLKPNYNIFCGTPGETYEDLVETKNLMESLALDNSSCTIGLAADWKPMPGTVLTALAVSEYSLKLPETLEGWAKIESFDAKKIEHPWYTKRINDYIKLLQVSGLLIDKKVELLEKEMCDNRFNLFRVLFLMAKMYRPFLRLRLKYNYSVFLIEFPIRNILMKLANRLSKAKSGHM